MELQYNIISVDDDTFEHVIMTRALRDTPYTIKCFEDANEALAFLTQTKPQFLFVDYRMHGIDGLEFIHQLESATDVSGMTIYLTSTSPVADGVIAEVEAAGASFILKDVLSAEGYLANLCAQSGNSTLSE